MEVKSGYKRSEVGLIPEDWDAVELDAVCSMRSGEGITAASIDQVSEYPCYGGNGLRGYTSRFTHDGSYALVGRQGALCGNVVGAEGRFFASEHAVVVTARSGTDIRYLTYVLGEMRLNRFSESSAQPGLSVSKVLKLPLPVPPTETEQRAIATALSDVDALLGGLDRLIAKKRDLKQAAMQQLLTGQTRLPGFHSEWEVKRIADVATPSSEKNTAGERLTVLACSKHLGFMDSLAFFKNQVFSADLSTYKLIRRNEIGYPANHVEEGSIGLQDLYDTALVSPIYVVFRVTEDVSSFFLHRLLKLDSYRQRFKTATTSSVDRRGSLRWPAFCEITVRLPPTKAEQTAIATILSDMEREVAVWQARRDKTHDLKEAMMQELLTGRTRLFPAGAANA
jgi:type I restriction enzyme S subunit